MKIKDKDCIEFKELARFVFDGKYEEIDNWFKKHQISKKPALERELSLRILNEIYFFSFRSLSTSRKEIDEEGNRREIAILKNLKCENQLRLFNVASVENVNHKHFEAMKLTKKNKELIENSSSVGYVITKLFNKENFDELEKIESIFKRSLLEQKSSGATIMYKEKYSNGTYFFKIDEPIFSPKYDIVFNYSSNKKEYLEKKGIDLPTVKEAANLHILVLKSISERANDWRPEDVEKINKQISDYKIQKNYLDLNENLGNIKKSNKKFKI